MIFVRSNTECCVLLKPLWTTTPYGKDKLLDRLTAFLMCLSRVKFGKLNCSRLTDLESFDPDYWVQQGYGVVQAGVRGMHKSEGQAGVLRQQDAERRLVRNCPTQYRKM